MEMIFLHNFLPSTRLFFLSPFCLLDRWLLILGEEVWHLPSVEQVVDVFNKDLVIDLGVAEEEHGLDTIASCAPDQLPQVLLPLLEAVRLRDGDLEGLDAADVGGQAAQALPSRADCLLPGNRLPSRP